MFSKLTNFSIKFRWLIIALFIIIGLFFASKLPLLEIDTDIKSMLPAKMPAKLRSDKIEEMFGGTEIIMVSLSTDNILNKNTLERVKNLSNSFKSLDSVDKVMSLSETNDIRAKDGELQITGFLKRIPKSKADMDKLQMFIKDNETVYGTLVAKDFSATAIVLILKPHTADAQIVTSVKEIINQNPGDEKIDIAGLPYIRSLTSKYMKGDMKKFMPIGFLIMVIFLYLCFKEIRGVILPFLVVILSVIIAMGTIYFLGWKVQLVTILLPVILIAIANDYGIHLISEYQSLIKDNSTMTEHQIIKEVMKSLSGPVMIAGITTIIGMLCLLSHIIVPAKQLGVLAAIGIFVALIASLTLIPAILSFLPKSKEHPLKKSKVNLLEKVLFKISKSIPKNSKRILWTTLIIVIILGIGIRKIIIDTNPVNYFNKNSPIVKSDRLINEKFGGSTTISIVASGDMKDYEIINKVEKLENKLEARKKTGTVTSITDVLKKMNKSLNNNDESYNIIPKTLNAISEYYLLYSMTGDAEDLEKLIDFDYKNILITERLSSASAKDIKGELDIINNEISNDNNSPFKIVGGYGDILSELVTATVNGQLISLFTSLIVVGITVAIFFKSPTAGILCTIPILFALVILFGLMGYFKIELNIITALLTSIMIGVGIDYSIHFLWRFKKLKEQGKNDEEASILTLNSIGRGIIFNALSVIIGFFALTVSNFMPIKFFGLLIIISISTCLFAALFILPALCIILKPFSYKIKSIKGVR